MPYSSQSRGSSPLYTASPYSLSSTMDSDKHPTTLNRNQSVVERNYPIQTRMRRTKSFSLSEDAPSFEESRPPLRFYMDDAIHELFRSKDKGARSRGGPLRLISGLFACWHPRKAPDARRSASKRVTELLEISRKQQSELADNQDTIDMLEWQLEQMQALALLENEVEPARRSTASANGLAVLQGESKKDSKEELLLKLEEKGQPNQQAMRAMKEGGTAEKHMQSTEENHELQAPDSDRSLSTLLLFEMATMRARFSIRSFSKALIKQMEASGYSVLRTLSELEPNVAFVRKEHVVYTLESRINKAFFHCFENDSFDDSGLMQILDPTARCATRLDEFQRLKLVDVDDAVNSNHQAFDPEFRRFCETKTRELWSQFSWNIVFNSTEERDVFTAAFLDAAKGVWLLHRLAFSLNPHVDILRVGKGLEIDPFYVEAVPNLAEGSCNKCSKLKVEFLIMPGFRAMDKVIKCQVYQHVHC